MFQMQPPMTPDRTAHLLERVIYDKVHDLIDHGKLNELEEQLAISLSLLPGVTDAEMLAGARAAIGRALRELAHAVEHPPTRDPEHHIRYLNAICAEVDDAREASPHGRASGLGPRASTDAGRAPEGLEARSPLEHVPTLGRPEA